MFCLPGNGFQSQMRPRSIKRYKSIQARYSHVCILIARLGSAIQQQFVRWQLTVAESAVALLLLKGLSLKEIAAVRATSERTVREQARCVYRKAGISGRPALAAFFLEDLLLPPA